MHAYQQSIFIEAEVCERLLMDLNLGLYCKSLYCVMKNSVNLGMTDLFLFVGSTKSGTAGTECNERSEVHYNITLRLWGLRLFSN